MDLEQCIDDKSRLEAEVQSLALQSKTTQETLATSTQTLATSTSALSPVLHTPVIHRTVSHSPISGSPICHYQSPHSPISHPPVSYSPVSVISSRVVVPVVFTETTPQSKNDSLSVQVYIQDLRNHLMEATGKLNSMSGQLQQVETRSFARENAIKV